MHLHWKNHETVKVVCKPCRPGQVHQYAEELARLSKGVVVDIMPNDIIILYRGRNYVQPDVMSPPDTLSKAKLKMPECREIKSYEPGEGNGEVAIEEGGWKLMRLYQNSLSSIQTM